MKRLVFSFVSFGATLTALIISFFATISVLPLKFTNYSTSWTFHNVIWGPAYADVYSNNGITTRLYQLPMDAINLYSIFLIIALIIGILSIILCKKDNLKVVYFAFAAILLVAAIAFFGSYHLLAACFNESLKITDGTNILINVGHILCGAFLLIASIFDIIAGIFAFIKSK